MSGHEDKPPDALPECPPVPIAAEDVDTIRDVLHEAVRVWEYPQSAVPEAIREFRRLAETAEALAIMARATVTYHEPLLKVHLAERDAAEEWQTQHWRAHIWGRTNASAAGLAVETLAWAGVLEQLAHDEHFRAQLQELIARFLTLPGPSQEAPDKE